jgi:hypothetical protein
MNVICHETVSPNLTTVAIGIVKDQLEIVLPVGVGAEHILAVIAPLGEMIRLLRNKHTWLTDHAMILASKMNGVNKYRLSLFSPSEISEGIFTHPPFFGQFYDTAVSFVQQGLLLGHSFFVDGVIVNLEDGRQHERLPAKEVNGS